MELYKDKLIAKNGYFEGLPDAVDQKSSEKAIDYKKNVTRNYISISPEQIDDRISGTELYLTRKYDGELNLIYFDGANVFILNRSGRVRLGLPCAEEAGKALAKAGIKQAIIPSELYLNEEKGRTRVFDVLEALADEKRIKELHLAPFEIFELNDAPYRSGSYGETYDKLKEIFGSTDMCRPVICVKVDSKQELKEQYNKWVEEEGSEGIVIRNELPLVYKLKPRHTIDVAVIGFSEGTGDQKGQVRSLLLAMMPAEGQYQIIGRTGNGFDEEFKKELLAKYTPKIINSTYIETDSNHVAFHMVNPDTVIELMVNDVLFETGSGPISNPVLEIVNGQYKRIKSVSGVSFVYPIFQRFREDKTASFEDTRLSQIDKFAFVPAEELGSSAELPKSELLYREVYKKETGGKLMVQKFMLWHTKKEKNPLYPAYVFHYTNFSSDRKEPLQREVYISNDHDQIMEIINESITSNIKKGWEKIQ